MLGGRGVLVIVALGTADGAVVAVIAAVALVVPAGTGVPVATAPLVLVAAVLATVLCSTTPEDDMDDALSPGRRPAWLITAAPEMRASASATSATIRGEGANRFPLAGGATLGDAAPPLPPPLLPP